MKPSRQKNGGGLRVGGGALPLEISEQGVHTEEDAALMRDTQEHSCGVRESPDTGHTAGMVDAGAKKLQIAGEIRAWMERVLAETGWSPRKWANEAGVAPSTVQRAIKPDYAFVTSSQSLAKLAAAAKVAKPDLSEGQGELPSPQTLPIRYRVQAGLWFEASAAVQEYYGEETVAPDPAFANLPQWLEEPQGDSMNRLIPDGCVVLVVDAIEMGYGATDEDVVVVERSRDNGQLRERSLKQVHIRPDGGVELWPRSHNPIWNSAMILYGEVTRSGIEPPEGERVDVEIVGLVISYTKRLRKR